MSSDEKSVLVGLSGGVDSAIAALLLKRSGHHVIAAFMKNWNEDDGTEYCSAIQDFEDAQRVADRLDIELRTISFAAEYWDLVFEEFLSGYRRGLTPNPDVLCNREIKFKLFLDYSEQLGTHQIATGHYACTRSTSQEFGLFRPRDLEKDQTYFLNGVPRDRLARCAFPLADLKKNEVRDIARRELLPVADKPDSTGICFIGERRFSDFIARYTDRVPGEIRSVEGTCLGEHSGLAQYTIGQRKGIEVGGRQDAREAPWYVVRKDIEQNLLIVTQDEADLNTSRLYATGLNLLADDIEWFDSCHAMVRYRQAPQTCRVRAAEQGLEVIFSQPQRAITPGQYVVFYSGQRCMGGARIEHAGVAPA